MTAETLVIVSQTVSVFASLMAIGLGIDRRWEGMGREMLACMDRDIARVHLDAVKRSIKETTAKRLKAALILFASELRPADKQDQHRIQSLHILDFKILNVVQLEVIEAIRKAPTPKKRRKQ